VNGPACGTAFSEQMLIIDLAVMNDFIYLASP
jgi:hypothetical protein